MLYEALVYLLVLLFGGAGGALVFWRKVTKAAAKVAEVAREADERSAQVQAELEAYEAALLEGTAPLDERQKRYKALLEERKMLDELIESFRAKLKSSP
jgi:flavin-dependent dehydrogenase